MTDKMNEVENDAIEKQEEVSTDSAVLDAEQETISGSDESLEETNEVIDEKDAKISELESKLQDEENKLFRVLADFENAKRRATLDKEALNKYKAQSILTNLLPVLDNFERALAVETKTEEAQSLMTGMDMIYRSLVDALKGEGLVEIEAYDKEFDPNFHQAVMTGSEPDKSSGIVLEELQKGYMLKDRVLRPSMVKVNE
ncbi:nucleotide exchange factor GrpE [Sporosarcina thermotolerans]|uniref:Protein GrpE n=1 Tax=Sporosarcina thermotolerans TaxID=633404 RepID=A0AAW9A8M3_9BACL|nr:nucleotide exchange factor GrpE [Sporosarcina thermotolerans]MDW0117399.1 nucleotide exchange factor GrpE [Sporosarcina thermotolerans]WHT47535.1 nucleotide exchange factor GrpE [Sporosarcina thermotolerans]